MAKDVWNKPRPQKLGKPKKLSSKQKSFAKSSAKAAGRPYPNLVDNMRASRKFADGGIVDVAAPPIGTTDLSASGSQMAQPQQAQTSPYVGSDAYGTSSQGNVGTGITSPGIITKNRESGRIGIAPQAEGFAKGGLVQVRGNGRARSKPCRMY